ncbi:MAG: hypothetical protein IKP17_02595 [Oscillospiraceae bacterium]|nr:hypothetical protein [Oscillospiraceae bacterium]
MDRKRWICFLLLAALLAGLAALPIAAEDTVFFTAVNNTLLELDAATMPVIYSSLIYVPGTLFNNRALDTYAYYSRESQMVLISDGEKILYFDMSAGDSYDNEDTRYRYAALYVNDTAYVPAYFVAEFFGLGYSYIRREGRHIVRITKGSAMSDDEFFSAASSLMETRLNQYLSAETAAPTPAETTPAPTPTATARPTPPPTATPTPDIDRSGVRVRLCFLGLNGGSGEVLDALDGTSACFFCTAEELYAHAALARRILGSGCSLGLLIREDPEKEYPAFHRALRDTAMAASFLAAGTELDEGTRRAAESAGLCLASPGTPHTDLAGCRRTLEAAAGGCDLLLDGDFGDTEPLLALLERDHYTVETVSEVTLGR